MSYLFKYNEMVCERCVRRPKYLYLVIIDPLRPTMDMIKQGIRVFKKIYCKECLARLALELDKETRHYVEAKIDTHHIRRMEEDVSRTLSELERQKQEELK